MTSYQVTSYQVTSYQVTSYQVTSYQVINCQVLRVRPYQPAGFGRVVWVFVRVARQIRA